MPYQSASYSDESTSEWSPRAPKNKSANISHMKGNVAQTESIQELAISIIF